MKNLNIFLTLILLIGITYGLKAQAWTETGISYPTIEYPNFNDAEAGRSVAVYGDYAVMGAPGVDSNAGRAVVFYRNAGYWEQVATLSASHTQQYSYFGCSVDIQSDIIVIGAKAADGIRSGTGVAYIFKKPAGGWEDMNETAVLKADNGYADDNFGQSVAVDGDYIVIGAPGRQSSKGAAYVFKKSGTDWTDAFQDAVLTRASAEADDYLGFSVDISGDDIVAGAYGAFNNAGYVFVYTKPATGWEDATETAWLYAYDASDLDNSDEYLGYSVAVNNNTIIAGAYGDDGIRTDIGGAYIYVKPGTGWEDASQTALLTFSDYENSHFGYSVSVSENYAVLGTNVNSYAILFKKDAAGWTDTTDPTAFLSASTKNPSDDYACAVNIDNDNRVVVGAPLADKSLLNAGSLYIFEKPVDEWVNTYETAEPVYEIHTNINDNYGSSVSVDGDYAVIGAPGYYAGRGCAYVMHNNAGTWETVAVLKASDGGANRGFGNSVCISGNVIVAGSYKDNTNGQYSGSAYVFVKPTGEWTDASETAKLLPSDPANYDMFGVSVAISGDNIIIGANGDDDNGNASGSAYLYTKPTAGWVSTSTETTKLTASDGAESDGFGYSVDISGDNIVIGAYKHDSQKGKVYVFSKGATGWTTTETAQLTASDAQTYDNFGASLAVFGDNIIVGSSKDDDGGQNTGSAYIFEKTGTGWINTTETIKITASDGENYDSFGEAVDIIDDKVVVASSKKNSATGVAYIFEKTASEWVSITETEIISASDGKTSDYFAKSVSISGDNILAGAYYNELKGNNAGAAYFFKRSEVTKIQNENDTKNIYTSNNTLYISNISNSNEQLIIYNMTGQEIFTSKIKSEINLNLPKGIYIVKIQSKDKIYSQKLYLN